MLIYGFVIFVSQSIDNDIFFNFYIVRLVRFYKEIAVSFDIQDALDVMPCHAIAGTLGLLFTGAFASHDVNSFVPYKHNLLMLKQLLLIIVTVVYSFVGTFLLLLLTSGCLRCRCCPFFVPYCSKCWTIDLDESNLKLMETHEAEYPEVEMLVNLIFGQDTDFKKHIPNMQEKKESNRKSRHGMTSSQKRSVVERMNQVEYIIMELEVFSVIFAEIKAHMNSNCFFLCLG
jgi:hypothetical protein